jgi:membrane fusion protein (multidrug efflux system)
MSEIDSPANLDGNTTTAKFRAKGHGEEKRMEKESKGHEAPSKPTKSGMSSSTRKRILGIVLSIAVVVGGYLGYQTYRYVETDNAMVQAQATLLSAKVSGLIVRVDVEENQKVKAGDVLVEIRPDDYQNALAQRQSERDSDAAQLKAADANYQRTLNLFRKGASTQERLDAAEAQFHSLENKLKSDDAKVAQAKLDLEYTRVVAPSDGKVGRKSFEVGMFATMGQPLLGFVEGNTRWVVANLKETEMAHIAVGKKSYVTVDAIPGKEFEGVVESISPATGATFSLLPPDNATGNFTKVVQRVPVRIKLLNLTESEIDRLQTGLSAEVKIQIR